MISLTLFTLSVFAALTTAFPLTTTTRVLKTETWHVPRLQMHLMSASTGIPGNPPWPESSRFNSTIDFDVLIPDQTTQEAEEWKVNCQANWQNGTLPDSMAVCKSVLPMSDTVYFAMRKYDGAGQGRRPELSFVLYLFRTNGSLNDNANYLHGDVAITANTPSEPTGYLTCLLGRPYDGLRCEMGSYLSVDEELVVEGSEVAAGDEWK